MRLVKGFEKNLMCFVIGSGVISTEVNKILLVLACLFTYLSLLVFVHLLGLLTCVP